MHFTCIIFVLFQLSDTQTIVSSFKVQKIEDSTAIFLRSYKQSRWIGPSDLSAPEVIREQTSVRINQKKIWLKWYQNGTSDIQIIKRKQPQRTTHTGEKWLKCEWTHMIIIDTQGLVLPGKESAYTYNDSYGKKPFSCSKCGKNFTGSSNVLRHTLICA
ncbi:hypothetical protein LOAG_14927 [Loa loa]|uniref:C2H2-type domain-containing protein n=2 Tax=Loa loa TaxID=7209 RepID=A0A1S0TH90_LOALO|nr:hypothetical protein LOAG_14927 [Loa loa]EFO13601.2 hypothetical protein LOAG_14927 [Loa loa]